MEGSQGAEVAKDRAADDGLSDFCEQRIEEGGRVKRISRCNGRESSLICLLILSYLSIGILPRRVVIKYAK